MASSAISITKGSFNSQESTARSIKTINRIESEDQGFLQRRSWGVSMILGATVTVVALSFLGLGTAVALGVGSTTLTKFTLSKIYSSSTLVQEGYIQFHGYRTWYRIVGNDKSSDKTPLVCLHGGPGIPHDYLKSLEKIVKTGRRVIFYDQLGCGNSDRPTNKSLWTINFFKDELTTLLKELKIKNYHLYGHSWGGVLALEHALDRPLGLQSLILASSTASMPQWFSEFKGLRKKLPQAIQDNLDTHERNDATQSSDYQETLIYHLHGIRVWTKEVKQSFAKANRSIGEMWSDEFGAPGNLKNWDIRNKLAAIKIPTLITSGNYDPSTPLINKTLHDGIPGSKWVLFKKSAHMPHLEEPELYLKVLSDFLNISDTN